MNRLLAVGLVSLVVIADVSGADFPEKPVRLIVPFGAGGVSDIVARIVGIRLPDVLKQQVIVDNRPGAGGNIGGEVTARAAPDGYTIMVAPSSVLAINRSLYPSMSYNSATAFAPIARMATNANVLIVSPSLPVKSVKELIAFGKSSPGKLNFASTGAGGTIHLSGEMFKAMTGIDMVHVAYKTSPAAHVDLMQGQIQLMFDSIPPALPQIKAGKLRALGVTDSKRSQLMPDVPTIAEAGLPGYQAVNIYGFVGPAGMPRPVVDQLNTAIVRTLNMPQVRQQLLDNGAEPAPGSPEELAALIESEAARWGKVIKAIGLKLE